LKKSEFYLILRDKKSKKKENERPTTDNRHFVLRKEEHLTN